MNLIVSIRIFLAFAVSLFARSRYCSAYFQDLKSVVGSAEKTLAKV